MQSVGNLSDRFDPSKLCETHMGSEFGQFFHQFIGGPVGKGPNQDALSLFVQGLYDVGDGAGFSVPGGA